MVTTPLAHHAASSLRARSSMMSFFVAQRAMYVDCGHDTGAYDATPAAAAPGTNIIVNPWLGGGTRGGAGNGLSSTATFFGIATKRITPGRFEGMT